MKPLSEKFKEKTELCPHCVKLQALCPRHIDLTPGQSVGKQILDAVAGQKKQVIEGSWGVQNPCGFHQDDDFLPCRCGNNDHIYIYAIATTYITDVYQVICKDCGNSIVVPIQGCFTSDSVMKEAIHTWNEMVRWYSCNHK